MVLRQVRGVLIKALTYSKTEREPQGGDIASAKHQMKVRQPLGNPVFPTQVASGIMRGISLTCACRVLPLPVGLGGANGGKHMRKGGILNKYVRTHYERVPCTFITIPYFECKVSSRSLPFILALSTTETVTGVSL